MQCIDSIHSLQADGSRRILPNGIEYGMMAPYAEGLNILRHANVGKAKEISDA